MPYEGEYAGYKPLRRIAENPRVRELLNQYVTVRPDAAKQKLQPLKMSDVRPSLWQPDWIVAIDGSHAETPLRNGFPGAEASYITVASVMIDIEAIRDLDQNRPADPKAFRKTHQPDAIDCALPGANVIIAGEPDAPASLRRALFEVVKGKRMSEEGETLIETYEALLAYKPQRDSGGRVQQCPYDCQDDAGQPLAVSRDFKRACGTYACDCPLKRTLYSTDALRVYERMAPAGTNGAIFAEIMQVLERLWVIHILRTMEQNGWLSSLRRIAIVLDGPLAVFGQPAWLSQAIAQELRRLNGEIRRATGGMDLLMIGIEKTGEFVDHFEMIDTNENGVADQFPRQAAGLISDAYIKENIVFSETIKPYGADTYFGRKFFYKTKSGARLVASVPYLRQGDDDTTRAEASQYPRLAEAMGVLDQIGSSRFPNAVSPLVAAHAEAAIPLHLGSRVLEKLARELIKDEPG